ncbi:MAG: radical SAM protein [Clostridia bacterium]|jgi:biotin synthase|nr:radical SAM protein [Clostridia bacterium]
MFKPETKKDIREILLMPFEEFKNTVMPEAKKTYKEQNNDLLRAVAMLGFDNICKNQCLYCGMGAGNHTLERYRIDPETIILSAQAAYNLGFRQIFLISGEDPKYGFNNLLKISEQIKKLGFWLSMACGEFCREQYQALRAAGVDEYVLKFETSNEKDFNRLKPNTTFAKRLNCIKWIKQSGMALASGNIVDYPGQTLDDLCEDILLMRKLQISWAPVIPYQPAKNTPLAQEGGRGSLELNLKEIAILRLMMPKINITAQQPGENETKGLADEEGNLNALNAGANTLFADLLPDTLAKIFSVVDNRTVLGLEHIRKMAELSKMNC